MLFAILSIVMFLLAIAPIFIKTNEGIVIKIIWSVLMFLLGMICMIGAIQYMQYYCFENGKIVVKSLFGKIVELNINAVQVSIETLPTYFSWVTSIDKKWICIYDESVFNNILYKFKSGCSNKKKQKKIQIVLNQNNKKVIEQYLMFPNS